MRLVQRLLAPVGFAVVAFCYGLPFAALRLDDSTLHLAQTFSGRDLVIGGKSRAHVESMLEEHGPMQVLPNSEIPPYLGGDGVTVGAQPAFMVAFVLVVAGLAAAILAGDRVRAIVSAAAGAWGAAAMGLLGVGAGMAPWL